MVEKYEQQVDWTTRLKPGQKVVGSHHQEFGEVLGIERRGDAAFVHILRYGPGEDELYVPVAGVESVVGDRVYLTLTALDLVGEPWHEPPGSVDRPE